MDNKIYRDKYSVVYFTLQILSASWLAKCPLLIISACYNSYSTCPVCVQLCMHVYLIYQIAPCFHYFHCVHASIFTTSKPCLTAVIQITPVFACEVYLVSSYLNALSGVVAGKWVSTHALLSASTLLRPAICLHQFGWDCLMFLDFISCASSGEWQRHTKVAVAHWSADHCTNVAWKHLRAACQLLVIVLIGVHAGICMHHDWEGSHGWLLQVQYTATVASSNTLS